MEERIASRNNTYAQNGRFGANANEKHPESHGRKCPVVNEVVEVRLRSHHHDA